MKPAIRLITCLSLVLIVLGLLNQTSINAQEPPRGMLTANLNLRTGPGQGYTRILSLLRDTEVLLEARNRNSTWLLVMANPTQRGWLLAEHIKLPDNLLLADLPTSQEIIKFTTLGTSNTGTADEQAPDHATDQATVAPNVNIPLTNYAAQITPAIRAAMRNVYLKGLERGNNPRVFSRVGDCLIGHVWFFSQFGDGKANDLGPYGGLQTAIDYFSVSPRSGIANSFTVESMAAHSSFTAAAVEDELYANPALCQAGETPLKCEYRLNRPSVAILMFGVVDVASMSAGQFDSYLRQIVDQTIAHGTIPILTVAPENPAYAAKARQFNRIVINVAQQYRLPLINLRGALAFLPDKGLDPDGIHLTPNAQFQRVSFANGQPQTGLSIWNLLALQSLENVMRHIMN